MKVIMIFDTRPWWQKLVTPINNKEVTEQLGESVRKDQTTILMPGLRIEVSDVL